MRESLIPLVLVLSSCPLVLATGAPTLAGQGRPLPADRSVGADTINPVDLKTWLTVLASEEFGGRGTGQPGFQLAADYVREHFEALGLEPGGDDGEYFQTVPWGRPVPDPATWSFVVNKGGHTVLDLKISSVRGSIVSKIRAKGKAIVAVVSDLDDPPLDEIELEDTVVFLLITDESERRARSRSSAVAGIQREVVRAGRTRPGAAR